MENTLYCVWENIRGETNWSGKKLANREPFAKFYLPIIFVLEIQESTS